MSRKRIAFASIIVAIFALTLFGNHLNLNYRSLVASTQNAKPLLDEETLASYAAQLTGELTYNDIEFAIISRAGQSRKRMPEGVNYTHSAFWISNIDGGYDVYNLYHGEENRRISSLVADLPSDFIRPTRAHDVGIIVPSKSFQSEMKAYILSPSYGRMHNPSYSLISNPFDSRFQNCNEFVLDELASAIWEEEDTKVLVKKLSTSFEPTEIKAGFIRRRVAPFVDERLVMEDHGETIKTTTREDLIEFLENEGLLDRAYRLDLKPLDATAP